MNGTRKIATVFGGTGFVGRQIVRMLAAEGYTVKIATRLPERAYFLQPCGRPGQIVPTLCNYNQNESIAATIKDSAFVVNCVGLLFEKKKGAFAQMHTALPAFIAKACADAGVKRFVQISALGVDKATSRYAKTKLAGEDAVLTNFPHATILRPSVIFGPGDTFFNMFAKLAGVMPCLPLIGGGKTRFQPVYVGDVATATLAALTRPDTQGRIYELGGPEILTFKEIYARLFSYTQRKRTLVSLPFGIAKIQATFLGVLPTPPLTRDQVESLKTDNVVDDKALTLEDLGVTPTALDTVLPTYLARYRPGGRFADRHAA